MAKSEAVIMLETMAQMQKQHNEQVHPHWADQGYAYYRAIWVECAEMLDHFGWKWWKQQQGDLDQVKLELVDIWHFALSEMLRHGPMDPGVAVQLEAVKAHAFADESQRCEAFREAAEALALSSLNTKSFEMVPFLRAMATLPLSLEELYSLYIGKNVLNHFRQNHGYKTGDYRKLWQGREDNEHLVEVLAELRGESEQLPERLYQALEARYEAP
tara:strand:- start:927 stop:1571 length:645 start_codon:yes stop_codon:yes gene_type:complete